MPRPATSSSSVPRAYIAGLTMLARRELSEVQIRQRLARRGYEPAEIDEAVSRLRDERAIDDRRVAGAIARTQLAVRGRGRLRVRRTIEAAGIRGAAVEEALDEAFAEVDADALLSAALDRRLHGRARIADDRERQRLYRYLVTQGFDSDRILALLRTKR